MRSLFMRTILTDVKGLIYDAVDEQNRLLRFLEFYEDKEIPTPPSNIAYIFGDEDLTLTDRTTYSTYGGLNASFKRVHKYVHNTFRVWLTLSRVDKKDDYYNLVYVAGVFRNGLSFTIVLHMFADEGAINQALSYNSMKED